MLSKRLIKLVLFFAIIFGLQTPVSFAGFPFGFNDEVPANILVSYFDIANGNTFVQVTNIDSVNSVTIHVQIFADLNNCVDRDFTDNLTPNETHVYDISNLQSANGNPINFALPADSHGFVVISSGNGMGTSTNDIIGNFRLVRSVGYEYRVNSAASTPASMAAPVNTFVARFTDDWGANQADIVGVRIDIIY